MKINWINSYLFNHFLVGGDFLFIKIFRRRNLMNLDKFLEHVKRNLPIEEDEMYDLMMNHNRLWLN